MLSVIYIFDVMILNINNSQTCRESSPETVHCGEGVGHNKYCVGSLRVCVLVCVSVSKCRDKDDLAIQVYPPLLFVLKRVGEKAPCT